MSEERQPTLDNEESTSDRAREIDVVDCPDVHASSKQFVVAPQFTPAQALQGDRPL
jgi:hypothetical protein